MTMTNVDNKALCASARHFHISSCNGNDNNNYGDDDDECRRRGLVLKCRAFSYRVVQTRQQQQQSARTNDECQTMRPCARARNILAIVRKRTCYASNIDTTASQGNVELRRAWATSSNIDDLVHKRTRLSSLVCKRTSYSVKHRRNNQPFQCQA